MLAPLLYLGHSGLFQFQVEISKLKNSIAFHMVDILTLKINAINIKYYGTNPVELSIHSMINNNTNNTKEINMDYEVTYYITYTIEANSQLEAEDVAMEHAMLDFTDEGKGADVITVEYGEDILIR